MTDKVFVELGHRPNPYPEDVRASLDADAVTLIARYPHPRSALIPLLHLVQSVDGCITTTGIEFCAETLGMTGAEVSAVATFYSMFRRDPCGDYLVGVCTNTLCAVLGGDAILEHLKERLGIDVGHTTPDKKITLENIECNAACDYAPVVMINWEFFDNQTPESIAAIVDALRAGETATPTRGDPLTTFRDTARLLSGLT